MADFPDPAKRGFGGFSKYHWAVSIPGRPYNKLTWTNRRYMPLDLRSTMPVQAHKFVTYSKPPSTIQQCWVPRLEPHPQTYTAHPRPGTQGPPAEGHLLCPSSPATRSEEWSTLRQMLPSKGHYVKQKPENWGTSGQLAVPTISQYKPPRFPRVNSPMTNYVDMMHQTNKHFRLH